MRNMDAATRALYEQTAWEHLSETAQQIAQARQMIAECEVKPLNHELENLLDEMLEDFHETAALIDADASWLLEPVAGHA